MSYYFSYDAEGNRVEKTSINGQTKTITSGTDDDGNSFVSNDGVTAESKTDDFGRTTEVKTSLGEGRPVFFTNYGYYGGRTSNRVVGLTQTYGTDELAKYQYTYDGNGNIVEVKENGVVTAKYTYDELNQLVWSGDRNTNLYTQMAYDNAGNITRVDIYSLGSNWAPVKLLESRTYTYGDTNWCDKLTGYNGTAITYYAVGNPLSYRDGMTMSWQNGRQLASLQTNDNNVAYKYDSNGMRTQKNTDGVKTNYYYDSSNNLIGLSKGNNTLLFYYNPIGEVTSFKYNGEMYYYIKNLQGDIVKIIDQSGAEAASYKYDSWGKITAESGSSLIRELNPFRYRGYVYDTETGLYYLQSRYYDPITGRFLNADVYCDTQTGSPLSTNMFAYCENNSVIYLDLSGYAKSYSIGYNKGKYNIMGCISFKGKKHYYLWTCNNGCIQFDFKKYDLYELLKNKKGEQLAEQILDSAKNCNSKYLKGRTKKGIYCELVIHYILYRIGYKKDHTQVCDMGSSKKNTIGYDSNASFFEIAATIKDATKFANQIINNGLKRINIGNKFKIHI